MMNPTFRSRWLLTVGLIPWLGFAVVHVADAQESPKSRAKQAPSGEQTEKSKLPPPLPIELHLFRPDSLAGWTHADEQPNGWSIDQGRLIGKNNATRLLSGYCFKDFELRFDWTAAASAALKLELPLLPRGPALSILFSETSNCAQIWGGDRTLASGKSPGATQRAHTAEILRKGKILSVTIDGQLYSQVNVAPERRFGLALSNSGGDVSVANMRLRESLGQPIFNGKDLTGWWHPYAIDSWQAINGHLVLVDHRRNWLRTERTYGNFTLSMEFKIRKRGNSGLAIRTARDGWPSADGMELQILDGPHATKDGMAAIYRNVPPIAVAHESEQWNQLVVKAEGRMISAWINGQLVQQVNTAWESELQHRRLEGWIGLQDHGARIEVRHLRVSESPEGLGLDAWYKPPKDTAFRFVLDRLLNTERLSRDDDSRGRAVTCEVTGAGKHGLAEWAGPGALVRVAGKGADSDLALYFDGENEPRIKCKTGDLGDHVPRVPDPDDKGPLLTCVPFKKSLKIVLIDGGPATFQFDTVRLPSDVEVATCESSNTELPASLEAVLDYRLYHHARGNVRQHDPYLRMKSGRQRLDAGGRIDAIELDGAGLVQWLQLYYPKTDSESNDLWIEITVDGEKNPALAAPIRYFFAGASRNAQSNFLLTELGGPINRLAIPFGDGIRMSLVNHGNKPINGVGLQASIQQPANEAQRQDFTNRLRLRGVFRVSNEEESDQTWFERQGRGRLVGLVWDDANPATPIIESLRIDGQPRQNWRPGTAANMLGRPGQTGNFHDLLSGRQGTLTWRYFLLAPIDFEHEITAAVAADIAPGDRLALFYTAAGSKCP